MSRDCYQAHPDCVQCKGTGYVSIPGHAGGRCSCMVVGVPVGYRLQPLAEFDAIQAINNRNDELEAELESWKSGKVHPRMKAGCIGEFDITVAAVCPACYNGEPDNDCEICHGAVEYNVSHTIPWDTMKDIFKAMCKFKAEGGAA